jgi:hypothetical protein
MDAAGRAQLDARCRPAVTKLALSQSAAMRLQLLAAAPMMRRAASSAVAFPEQFERAASVFLPDQVRLQLQLLPAGCDMRGTPLPNMLPNIHSATCPSNCAQALHMLHNVAQYGQLLSPKRGKQRPTEDLPTREDDYNGIGQYLMGAPASGCAA